MRKENINIVRDMFKSLGIDEIYIQGDNSNFFQDGKNIKGNAVIFDDNNELLWAIRLYQENNYKYRITGFDYDHIQYLSCGASEEQVKQFLSVIGADEETINKFIKSKYDKVDYSKIVKYGTVSEESKDDKK